MVDFGSKLKQLRMRSGMTQKQLGDKIGVTKSVISYYELQERYPSPDVLIKLAGVFRVSTDYLLGLDPKRTLDISDLSDSDVRVLQQIADALRSKQVPEGNG